MFRIILQDFHNTFLSGVRDCGDYYVTEKFYQSSSREEDEYRTLLVQYEYQVDLVQDLLLELTRAANLICDEVRSSVMHWYRRKEGRLMVQIGPTWNMRFETVVVQYEPEETKTKIPYASLEKFRADRAKRDLSFGNE